MLFVFHVDTGTMMTLDMNLALESVENLKVHVEKSFKIPVDKQVLLVSGGECLDSNKRVCSYSGGTDSNPIFLFSKSVIESPAPPLPSVDYGSEGDLKEKLREYCDLPATLSTVTKRAQLAQQFQELAKEQTKVCEGLVYDQHMQQQGWFAVVANLEDIASEFKKRSDIFINSFNDYMHDRDSYLAFLKHFNDDLEILQRIPVLPTLLELEKKTSDPESKTVEDGTNTSQSVESSKEISLLQWISSADSKSAMDQLYEHCFRGLEQFDTQIFEGIKEEIKAMLKSTDNPDIKEVRGLGDRLSGLETLMRETKSIVQQQADLAQSFLKNQSRASNLKDQSILPDLCASHRKQLQLIAMNHQKLCDIRRRCLKAKEELSINIHQRLKWVMCIEDGILQLDHKLVIYHENLKRLRRHLEVLQQIHMAPATYLSAVAEVVRRRTFSQTFLLWASELACHLLTIHNEEVTRRKEFQSQFESHFLSSLFPGMEDMPPSFATQAPSMFDSSLPKITVDDVERLKKELPDLADSLNAPDISSITTFFLMKSAMKKEDEKVDESRAVEDKLVQAVSEVGLASNLDHNLLKGAGSETCLTTPHGLPHLKDLDKGCESETDTEEFEKVGQSPLELNFDKQLPSTRPGTQDASTSTEVGERGPLGVPPKKPPRIFQKSHLTSIDEPSHSLQRTLSVSSASNTESFTNIKNPSLDSIDEFSSLKNFTSNTESCFNSHYQQMQICNTTNLQTRSKSISPHTPQSPKDLPAVSPNSPVLGHQPGTDFINDEFYIDESLPSSISIETGTSQTEFVKQLDTANNVVALLQDNLQISRSEHEKLKSTVVQMHYLAKEAKMQLRSEFNDFRTQVLTNSTIISQQLKSIGSLWENLMVEKDYKEKELVESIKRDYEKTLNDLKKTEEAKNEKIQNLLSEKNELEAEILRSCENLNELQDNISKIQEDKEKQIEELRNQLQEKELEKEKQLKETTERLNREHATELQNIRSRFKLMTMERSPPDSSPEWASQSITSHQSSLIAQITENFELDKEKAVTAAIHAESEKWEHVLANQIKGMETKFQQEKEDLLQDAIKRISEEKDKQIEILTERERNLSMECTKYKNTIQQLTETESNNDSELLARINILQREKEKLEIELERIKMEKVDDLTASVAVVEGRDAATSPIKQREGIIRSETSVLRSGKLNIESCKAGDLVVVMWDPTHESFQILQENKHLYFLHSDYSEPLGLEIVDGKPNKFHCIGVVIEKEYCHARKSENRYKVPKGTKFFRVKVQPCSASTTTKEVTRSLYHPKPVSVDSSNMSQSHSAFSTITEIIPEDKTDSPSLPPSPIHEHPTIMENKSGEVDLFTTAVEGSFAEDSGIVDIEQAASALDVTLTADSSNEGSDR